MGRKAVRKLVKKAPKLIFTIATSTNQTQTQKNKKKNKKSLSYVVNDDVLKLMRKQLADIGCKLHEVKGDGNCLFRALSDQLFGDQQQYQQVREKIVNYLEQHRNDFEPFMEDEEKFEKYCDRMRDNGTWGGNQELYAAARLFQVYIIVHQNQPSARIMVIECDQLKPTRVIHVAYHGEDHYDSVRAITDPIEPDSLPVSIELDCNGFRSEEFAKRWQTQATPVASDEQRVVPKSSIDPADGEVDQIDQLASSLGDQLQIAARTGNDVAKMTLSKKEKRQMRKVAKAASRSARKLQSTLK
ncbi:hypothetical protein KXD40_008237 [Peronospora effusa]|uniref:OTU domain-containing protein n=1 Tax=Peronospora effusa TaxID=542832 RepID=A0A3M6VS47_9STRA|nr:hypothetical protein DD238_002029 [Peronospora effusa]UIZ24188.1 hypothetical protein KXD40_008237 [Peronospora effusa]CAI5707790.1 unnamed protein product [Peronospora effusa]